MYVAGLVWGVLVLHAAAGCNFYPVGEYLRFVRIPEDLEVGEEVLRVEVHPRYVVDITKKNLSVQAVENAEDAQLFTYRDVNRTHVAVLLARTLDGLVDRERPRNVLRFRLGCDFDAGDDLVSAYLSVTVYVEDVNDHSPQFEGAPYSVMLDELTPVGSTVFSGISARDTDKPDTPNSDVHYRLEPSDAPFSLLSARRPLVVLTGPLDYDHGDRNYRLTVVATDRGAPPRSNNTSLLVRVQDSDDQPPVFTRHIYRASLPEFYPFSNKKIHKELIFDEPIKAVDQDMGVGTPVRYDLVAGNERKLFSLSSINGSLFLEKEIDLDQEDSLPGNTFVLQVQAAQVDNPLKTAHARLEVEIQDLNDNLPQFEVDFYNISIVENLPNGFSVLQVMATDRDQGDNGEFTYELSDPREAFTIDPRSGWLTVRNQSVLDRERHSSLKMKVYAKEKNPSIVGGQSDRQRLAKWRRPSPAHRAPPSPDKTTYVFPDRLDDLQQPASVTVEVTLLDANDNNPTFLPTNLYEFAVRADAAVGSLVGKVAAVDPDLGRNGVVLYDLQRTSNLTVTSPFQVEANSGVITVVETPLVRGRHALFVEAADQPANPSERRYSLAVVTVDVVRPHTGSKEDNPDFVGAPYEFWVGSNVGVGTSVGQVRVNGAMERRDVLYDLLHSYEDGVPFAVEERSGVITVIDDLTKFNRPMYDFEAVASQENTNVTLATNATVHVVDVRDDRGVLLKGANAPMVFHVKENVAGATVGQLFQLNITSLSMNNSGKVNFIIANQQDVTEDIAIGQDGTIFTQRPLDREKRDVYRLTVIAEFNKGLISGAGIYQVVINIDDENDNPPVFDSNSYEGIIFENSRKGTEVNLTSKVKAKDADADQNALFVYTLFGDGHELFDVDEVTGCVYFTGTKLDREEKNTYLLKLVARDKGNLSSEAKLTVNVVDENDNKPKFNHIIIPVGENIELLEIEEKSKLKVYCERKSNVSGLVSRIEALPGNKYSVMVDTLGPLFKIPENVAIGSTILKLNAVDMDSGSNGQVRYEFVSETFMPPVVVTADALNIKRYFVINEKHGHVIVARSLPPEAEFRLNISAIDGGGMADNMYVRLFIQDINDHRPVFRKSSYSFVVEEAPIARRVLGKVDATDADFGQNANVTYYIEPSGNFIPFEISPLSGVFSVNGELDREREDRYEVTVVARDGGGLAGSVRVEVTVLDVNDNAPVFRDYDDLLPGPTGTEQDRLAHDYSAAGLPLYRAQLGEDAPPGTTVVRLSATDDDLAAGGAGLVLYSLRADTPALFTIHSTEGVVTTVGRLDYERRAQHNVTVVAADLGVPSRSSSALLVVEVRDVPNEAPSHAAPAPAPRYFELEVDENTAVPLELLQLELSEPGGEGDGQYEYWLAEDTPPDVAAVFAVDTRGILRLVVSPDREMRDLYTVTVRAARVGRDARGGPRLVYPPPPDLLEGMRERDARVVVRVRDVNDNAPRFAEAGRPQVAAVRAGAGYGEPVLLLRATDADAGLNADVRYQILNEPSRRFAVDAVSGQVRAVGSLARDVGRVFGFDVKATDRRGQHDGLSAIVNVLVHVLHDRQQLSVRVSTAAARVESAAPRVSTVLSRLSGLDVRVRALQPDDRAPDHSTELFLYAVDPATNTVVDADLLQKSLMSQEAAVQEALGELGVGALSSAGWSRGARGGFVGGGQLAALLLGGLMLVGGAAAGGALLCVRRARRRSPGPYSPQRLSALSESALFPGGGRQCRELVPSEEGYVAVGPVGRARSSAREFGRAHQMCLQRDGVRTHERLCLNYNKAVGSGSVRKTQDTSIASAHSSGHDSGIADRCGCTGTQHTTEDSSGCSYEDSLKSGRSRPECVRPRPLHPARRSSLGPRGPVLCARRLPAPPAPPAREPVVDYEHDEHTEHTERQRRASLLAPSAHHVRRASARGLLPRHM